MQSIIFAVGVVVSFMVMGGFFFSAYSTFDSEFRKKEKDNP